MSRRRILLWLSAAVALVLTLASGLNANGFRRYWRLRGEVAAVTAENRASRERNRLLRAEVESLRQDRFALERAAREELGFVKTGEIVINLEQR